MKSVLLTRFILLTAALIAAASSPASTASPAQGATSLAIVIRSADADSKYLASEYARNLIHAFGGNDSLAVVPRARVLMAEVSTETPAEIGRALFSTHVLIGRVGATVQGFEFSVGLIESSSKQKRWQEIFHAPLAEGGTIPDRVVPAVARALGLTVPARAERAVHVATANLGAWSAYLQGRRALETLTEPSLVAAIEHFERAISADPKFTLAQVALSTAHIALGYNFRNPRVHFTKAREYLARAAAGSAPLAEAVTADAVLKFYHERDWHGAARGARFVTENDPSAVETHACFLHCAQTIGQLEAGQREIKSAHHFQPGSLAIRAELPCAAYYAGRYAEAEAESRAALRADPANPMLHWSLARALAQQGKLEAALVELQTAQGKPGGEWSGILAEIAYIHGRQNRRTEAMHIIAQLREREKTEYVDAYLFAMASVGLGETSEVCRQLEQAVANDSTWISSVALEPKFAGLRADPNFIRLLTTLQLPAK